MVENHKSLESNFEPNRIIGIFVETMYFGLRIDTATTLSCTHAAQHQCYACPITTATRMSSEGKKTLLFFGVHREDALNVAFDTCRICCPTGHINFKMFAQ